LEHGRMVKVTGKEHALGPMVPSMLEHGGMMKCTGKEYTLGTTVESMWDGWSLVKGIVAICVETIQ